MADQADEDDQESFFAFTGDPGSRHLHRRDMTLALLALMLWAGLFTLPAAVEATGLIGFALLFVLGLAACFTASVLAECWLIVKERYPDMPRPVRHQYPHLGMVAFGNVGRIVITVLMNWTFYVTACSLLVFTHSVWIHIFKDEQLALFGLVMNTGAFFILTQTTRTFPPIDKSLWMLLFSLQTSVLFGVLFVISMLVHLGGLTKLVSHRDVTPTSFAGGVGTICLAFGGHILFPSFQSCMLRPRKFARACWPVYAALVVVYLLVAVVGYFGYGSALRSNIYLNVPFNKTLIGGWLMLLAVVFQPVYPALAATAISFVKLDLLQAVGGTPGYSYPYLENVAGAVLSVLVLLAVLFVPYSGPLLSLVGGSSVPLLSFVLPPLIYFRLAADTGGDWPRVRVGWFKGSLLALTMVGGMIIAGWTTFYNLQTVSTDFLSKPFSLNCTEFINSPLF